MAGDYGARREGDADSSGFGIGMTDGTQELTFALTLADVADRISMAHFDRGGVAFESKADRSPVSAADLAVEEDLRELVAAKRRPKVSWGKRSGASGPRLADGSSTASTERSCLSEARRDGPKR